MITFITTDKLKKKIERAKKLQKVSKELSLGIMKIESKEIVKIFHDGIINDDLGLKALKDETIASKSSQKMPHPSSPLAGKSDARESKKDTYANLLRIKKTKNGYSIYPSTAKHWSGKIKLSDLFQIHEHGMKIQTASGKIIQIPKRPALRNSYAKYKNEKRNAKEIYKKITTGYIERGSHIDKINSYLKEYRGK